MAGDQQDSLHRSPPDDRGCPASARVVKTRKLSNCTGTVWVEAHHARWHLHCLGIWGRERARAGDSDGWHNL